MLAAVHNPLRCSLVSEQKKTSKSIMFGLTFSGVGLSEIITAQYKDFGRARQQDFTGFIRIQQDIR